MLPKTQRISLPYLKNALSQRSTHFVMKYAKKKNVTPQFGVVVSKKHVSKAFERNAIRRKVYRQLQSLKTKELSFDIVFILQKPLNANIDISSEIRDLYTKIEGSVS